MRCPNRKHRDSNNGPDAPEPNIPKLKPTLEGVKPVEEKTTNLQWNPQSRWSQHQVQTRNFKLLKEEWISPFKQLRINSIERKLEGYKDLNPCIKPKDPNAFTRAYRKTMTRDDKLRKY